MTNIVKMAETRIVTTVTATATVLVEDSSPSIFTALLSVAAPEISLENCGEDVVEVYEIVSVDGSGLNTWLK